MHIAFPSHLPDIVSIDHSHVSSILSSLTSHIPRAQKIHATRKEARFQKSQNDS